MPNGGPMQTLYNQSASNKTEPVCSWLSMLLSSCLEILVGFHLSKKWHQNLSELSSYWGPLQGKDGNLLLVHAGANVTPQTPQHLKVWQCGMPHCNMAEKHANMMHFWFPLRWENQKAFLLMKKISSLGGLLQTNLHCNLSFLVVLQGDKAKCKFATMENRDVHEALIIMSSLSHPHENRQHRWLLLRPFQVLRNSGLRVPRPTKRRSSRFTSHEIR